MIHNDDNMMAGAPLRLRVRRDGRPTPSDDLVNAAGAVEPEEDDPCPATDPPRKVSIRHRRPRPGP